MPQATEYEEVKQGRAVFPLHLHISLVNISPSPLFMHKYSRHFRINMTSPSHLVWAKEIGIFVGHFIVWRHVLSIPFSTLEG